MIIHGKDKPLISGKVRFGSMRSEGFVHEIKKIIFTKNSYLFYCDSE